MVIGNNMNNLPNNMNNLPNTASQQAHQPPRTPPRQVIPQLPCPILAPPRLGPIPPGSRVGNGGTPINVKASSAAARHADGQSDTFYCDQRQRECQAQGEEENRAHHRHFDRELDQ